MPSSFKKSKFYPTLLVARTGKIRFSGTQKSLLLKPSSGECCAAHNFVLLVTLEGKRVCLTCSPHLVPHCASNEIGYGKIDYVQMKQCNNILQLPHERAEMLSKKRKSKLCFPG